MMHPDQKLECLDILFGWGGKNRDSGILITSQPWTIRDNIERVQLSRHYPVSTAVVLTPLMDHLTSLLVIDNNRHYKVLRCADLN